MRKKKGLFLKIAVPVLMMALFVPVFFPENVSAKPLDISGLSEEQMSDIVSFNQNHPFLDNPIGATLDATFGLLGSAASSAASSAAGKIVSGTLGSILDELREIMSDILVKSVDLLKATVNEDLASEVFFSEKSKAGILAGWSFVRDFLNLFYLLILIFIAIATILRVNQFSDKKIFVYVLISAIFINFSLPITMVIIDISNLATSFFANLIQGLSPGVEFLDSSNFVRVWQEGVSHGFSTGELASKFIEVLFLMFIAITMLFIAISLIIRYVAFWVLLVLSPFAIFSFAMPGKSGVGNFWNEWSKKLFSYAFYAPALLFFMSLELILMKSLNESVRSTSPGTGLSVRFTAFLIQQIVLLYLLYYGYATAKHIASGSGEAVTKILNKGQSFATNTLKSVGYNYGKDVGKGAWTAAKERVPVLRYFASEEKIRKRKERPERMGARFTGGETWRKYQTEQAIKQAKDDKDKGGKAKDQYQEDLRKGGIDSQAAALRMAQEGMIENNHDLQEVLRATQGNVKLQRMVADQVRDNLKKKSKEGRLNNENDYAEAMAVLASFGWDGNSRAENQIAMKDIQRETMRNNADIVLDADIGAGRRMLESKDTKNLAQNLEGALRTNVAFQNTIKEEEERREEDGENGFSNDAEKARWLADNRNKVNLEKSAYAQFLKGKSTSDVVKQKRTQFFDKEEVQQYLIKESEKNHENTERIINMHAAGRADKPNTVKAKIYKIIGSSQTSRGAQGNQGTEGSDDDIPPVFGPNV